jgi:Flp pilus assembly pilin Flp
LGLEITVEGGNKMKMLKDLYARLVGAMHSEEGQTLVEYALLLVLIAIVVYLMLRGTGEQVNTVYSTINSALGVQ